MSVVTDRRSADGGRSQATRGMSVEPPRSRRRVRVPELALAVLMMAGFGLVVLWLVTSGRERTPMVALAVDVARGEVIDESHLSTVYVGSDSDISGVRAGDEASLVGRTALTDLEAGALVTPEQFGEPVEVLSRGAGVVGLSLDAGQLPSLDLAPGDRVSVVAGVAAGAEDSDGGVVIDAGEVVSFERLGDVDQPGAQARWWVAVRATEGSATNAAAVAAGGTDMHLVLVDRDGSADTAAAGRP